MILDYQLVMELQITNWNGFRKIMLKLQKMGLQSLENLYLKLRMQKNIIIKKFIKKLLKKNKTKQKNKIQIKRNKLNKSKKKIKHNFKNKYKIINLMIQSCNLQLFMAKAFRLDIFILILY